MEGVWSLVRHLFVEKVTVDLHLKVSFLDLLIKREITGVCRDRDLLISAK